MQVLGIDPGIHLTGWAVIKGDSHTPKLIEYGCITTPSSKPELQRLLMIADALTKICQKHSCHETAVEKIFVAKNVKTVISVSQARGVILVTLANSGCQVAEYTPLQIKQALTGYGQADKQQMQYMVKSLLKLKKIPKPDDAADAIAVAICHLQSYKYNRLVAK